MATSLKQLIDSYDPNLLLSEASTPPRSWYSDPRILDLEQRTVFSHSWYVIGRTEQLRKTGDYITCEVAGEPILLVIGPDGVLRSFYNVCRHHAAAVMTERQGRAEHLRCPYHGWTYNLEGALVIAPEFGGVCNFNKSGNGLAPVQTAIWQGWVFVKLVSNGPALEEFLGEDLVEQIRRLKLEQLSWFERRSYTVQCNWKVFIDNYLDGGYHVPHIHGDLNSVLDYSAYKIATGERFCVQSSPIITGKADVQTLETRQGQALYYWIYPNFMVNWYEGVMDTNLVVPRGIDRTEVIFDYYFTDVSEQGREKNLASIAVSERIQDEDVGICESVQRGLSSRSYSTGRLSVRREAGEHLFHRLLHADLKAGLANDARLI
ncbi:MAG TPA: aromatic ring-hydroxylating dioxygenase subunit alpha [Candidatus Binatia bacterium]